MSRLKLQLMEVMMVDDIIIPDVSIKGWSRSVSLHKYDNKDIIIVDVGVDVGRIDAKKLYEWLKNYYEPDACKNERIDDRCYVCSSSLY